MSKAETIHLLTPEGETLAGMPWQVYPRPQLRRDSFICLNGAWELSVNGGAWETVLVPFPPESLLSGIHRDMGPDPTLIYRRRFPRPDTPADHRVILHFGAVDQEATVVLNGETVGTHIGGYEAFSFDVTEALAEDNTLEVKVTDRLDAHILPYGKQRRDRGGMWYTPVTGIWQTVWMECVPKTHVRALRMDTRPDGVTLTAEGVADGEVTVATPEGEMSFPLAGGLAEVTLPSPRLWSPEDPYLYEFTLTAGEDTVRSYFALRTLDVRTVGGIPRLCLNGRPYFFHALLDQGYFSDGIYTPASPEGYTRDIREMKALGFNTLRKHIKVEPEQFYYDCDRLGMIVMQDMVNNGHYSFLRDTALPTVGIKRLSDKRLHRDRATRAAFFAGMEATVRQLFNHPCICYWTIFNEGWGQFDSAAAYEALRALDTSRFIDTASGWFKGAPSDVFSEHVYFKPVRLTYGERPMVLSEFGGYSYKPEGHVFNPVKTYGYRFFERQDAFEDALVSLYEREIIPAVRRGLCSAVYTQVSDVEDETNGLLSYDRRILKVSPARMMPIATALYGEMEERESEESKGETS